MLTSFVFTPLSSLHQKRKVRMSEESQNRQAKKKFQILALPNGVAAV